MPLVPISKKLSREAARRIGLRPADIESAVPLKPILWAGALGGVAIAATCASILLLAAVAHFVPYAGPALIAVTSAVAGTAQFDSVTTGLWIGACGLTIAAVIGGYWPPGSRDVRRE